MASLPLVIELIDLVDDAHARQRELDVAAEAERLLKRHPDAEVTQDEVAEMLEEQVAASVQ